MALIPPAVPPAQSERTHTGLPLLQVLAFASIALPLAAIGLPFAVYLPRFYAGEMGLGLETTGMIFMVLRFWDIATDPIMGYLVDRHPSRWGRIKHWLVLSVPILILSAAFLYMPGPGPVTPTYLIIWLLVFYVGFTMLQTPHQAWVPALAKTYDERSRLFQWREIVNVAALLSLLALPDLVARTGGLDETGQIRLMGLILIIGLPVVVLLALAAVPDRTAPLAQGGDFSLPSLVRALRNGALWRVLIIEICIGTAIAGTAATYLYAAEWGFGVRQGASAVLMLFFVAGFCAIPVWMRLARGQEKHKMVTAICLFAGLAYVAFYFLAGVGGMAALVIGAGLSGLAFGTPFILVRSMMADLVEREVMRTGENRAGLYYSLMTSAYKTGASFAVGIPFLLLALLVGFDPVGENDPATVNGLMLVFAGIPALGYVIAAATAWSYPVTRQAQADIADQLRERDDDLF